MRETISHFRCLKIASLSAFSLLSLWALQVSADELPQEGSTAVQSSEPVPVAGSAEPTFTIKRFVIEGSTLFKEAELQERLREFTGRKKTAGDVEKARDVLERYIQDKGYPTVMVNIPEQKVESRVIRLQVIEVSVGQVTVSGNRYFSTGKVLRDIPSMAPGEIIQVQRVQKELNRLNRHPDFKVSPNMQPGKAPETVDIELKVVDRSPVHGSLELSNRATNDTTPLRLSASLRHDNLWQREHSLSAQYQLSPQDPEEVQIASGSYTLPTPWEFEQKLVLYGVWSNTDTTFGGDNRSLGKGSIIGTRLMIPLTGVGEYSHTLVAGVDYKDFEDTVNVAGIEYATPVSYVPLSFAYSGFLRDGGGSTQFNAGLNVAFRGAVTNAQEFADKRYESRANYLYLTAGVERNQQLPAGFTLLAKLDGQLADQPLISNEQYSAGGIDNVRGYRESEASGDDAAHGVFELGAPNLLKLAGAGEGHSLTPYIFYDAAALWTKDPLAGQERVVDLQGSGIGCRGTLFGSVGYQADLAFALRDTGRTMAGDTYWHFRLSYTF